MFNRLERREQTAAAPFVRQVWNDLKSISGPNDFQNLAYQIAMESTHKLASHLRSREIDFDPDNVVFSVTGGGGYVLLFSVNLKDLETVEIWSIKHTP